VVAVVSKSLWTRSAEYRSPQKHIMWSPVIHNGKDRAFLYQLSTIVTRLAIQL